MMNQAETKRARFRQLLQEGRIIVAPGAYDGLSARLVQQAGFQVAYMSGAAVAASQGVPDVGLVTMAEMSARAAQMAKVIDIPLIADADDGYGNPINVYRTVQEFALAGVAGIHLEDQVAPKKCGSLPGTQVVTVEEMLCKLRAAQDARRDQNFVIIARTDAVWSHGLDEAIHRGIAYRDAGADLLMFHGLKTEEEIAQVVAQVKAPVVSLNSESGTMPMVPVQRLEEMGVAMVLFPTATLRRATYAMRNTLEEIMKTGTTKHLWSTSEMGLSLFNLVGLQRISDMEKRYGIGLTAEERKSKKLEKLEGSR